MIRPRDIGSEHDELDKIQRRVSSVSSIAPDPVKSEPRTDASDASDASDGSQFAPGEFCVASGSRQEVFLARRYEEDQ